MPNASRAALAVTAPVLALTLTGCGWFGSDAEAGGVSGAGTGAGTHTVLEMRRMGLGVAEEVASDGGIGLTSYDALGKSRDIGEPREWKVCFQAPEPGAYPVPVTAIVGVVLIDEACPSRDAGVGPTVDPKIMPDFVGRPATVLRTSLGDAASIAYRDEDGGGAVREEDLGDYLVCRTNPAPGSAYNGVPVTVDVDQMPRGC